MRTTFPTFSTRPTPGRRLASTGAAALAAALATALFGGCALLAEQTAPAKPASTQRSALAAQADAAFWQALHGGAYDQIERLLQLHTAAYLQDPGDAVIAAHTGWLHIWRLAESARLEPLPSTVTDHAVLARKYFDEAVRLVPGEARYQGFLGAALLAEGTIHHDERLVRRGWFTLQDGIRAWPEFNLFTAGYTMSRAPAGSGRFDEALQMQWRTLDLCAGTRVDRQRPDFAPYMARATTSGAQRVCWNSWIAPHNFEGFFLNMGDMLVKAGQNALARQVYANARLSPDYNRWPHRLLLEQRIADAPQNTPVFNARPAADAPDSRRLLIDSRVACMACHQAAR